MKKERIWFAVSAVLCAASAVLGLWGQDGFMTALSAMATIFAVLAFVYCTGSIQRYTVIMSVMLMICTAILVTVASNESLVGGGKISDLAWVFVSGIIHGVAVIPMILVFYFAVAAAFKASFNWVTAPGLSWLVGMGMILPPYVLVLFMQRPALLDQTIANGTIVIGALINLVMFIIFALVLRSVLLKGRKLITEKGFQAQGETAPYDRSAWDDAKNVNDAKERRIAWALLIFTPLSMAALFTYVTLGYAKGLAAGHPMIYLQMTCVLWAVIMLFVPIMRLLRLVSLPLWFMVILYADMYMYVLSLCHGMYFDIWWWANFTHVVSSLVVTSIIFMTLCLIQARSPPHVTLGNKGGVVAMLIMAALSFGIIWEMMEGFTDILTSMDYMSYGAIHTLENLGADLAGTMIMAVIALIILSRKDAKTVASEIRLGRKANRSS